MNPRSRCRKSIFDEEFKFQYESGDPHIHIATQNVILKFLVSFAKKVCQSDTLHSNGNKVSLL